MHTRSQKVLLRGENEPAFKAAAGRSRVTFITAQTDVHFRAQNRCKRSTDSGQSLRGAHAPQGIETC